MLSQQPLRFQVHGPGAPGCSGPQCPMSGPISEPEPPQVAEEVGRHWERWGWGPSPSLTREAGEGVVTVTEASFSGDGIY